MLENLENTTAEINEVFNDAASEIVEPLAPEPVPVDPVIHETAEPVTEPPVIAPAKPVRNKKPKAVKDAKPAKPVKPKAESKTTAYTFKLDNTTENPHFLAVANLRIEAGASDNIHHFIRQCIDFSCNYIVPELSFLAARHYHIDRGNLPRVPFKAFYQK